ncbi:MAG: inorganic phosphate transporter [Bacteroidales bacterium]|nr:inorganic phosphate transporter [Bacteroidales bacterium]
MENLYLVIVGVLFILAISDLVVGVSNDAVNFLNSAIGSKVASFKIIILVAALGVLVGAVFSSGMMEVARKGIFHPEMFYFSEIMLIFLAVMTTDIIMLDTFNTFGLPTSTTVSIVFELLGAAVGMASIKLMASPESMAAFKEFLFEHHIIQNINETLTLGDFINTGKALAIISGILFSVAVAFIVGAFVQYIARIIFSFNYKKRMKWFGGLWGGIAFTAITYFMIIKGVKGASVIPDDVKTWIETHTFLLMVYSFVFWTLFLQLLNWVFKINILKAIVLVGTFSLAMAFAGNDLVNFIGVPIAGYNAFEIFIKTPNADPNTLSMIAMGGKVATPTLFLLLAGLVMVLTLAFSRKARSVIKTSVDLSRQDSGDERFKASTLSKVLVRSSINMSKGISKMVPSRIAAAINRQFEMLENETEKNDPDVPAFDLIRASVNLVLSSVLIALGTSLTLPLSTTYVTFMVAMGSSLSDKAWDRESAVYRISGVFSVIGGWFLTAFTAFTISFIIIYAYYYGGMITIAVFLILIVLLMYRSHRFHKKREDERVVESEVVYGITEENLVERSNSTLVANLKKIVREYNHVVHALETEDIRMLRKSVKTIDEMASRTKYLKNHVNVIIDRLREDSVDSSYYLVEVLDYMREMVHSISFFANPSLEHVDNNHKPLLPGQIKELKEVASRVEKLTKLVMYSILRANFANQTEVLDTQKEALSILDKNRRSQIKRIKNGTVGTRNSVLYLNLLTESKNLLLQMVNLYKSQRDFIKLKNKV